MKRVRVKCEIFVEVELEDDADEIFVIEENGCPGTGIVYTALQALIEKHNDSPYCEFCAAQCENVIVQVLTKDKPG